MSLKRGSKIRYTQRNLKFIGHTEFKWNSHQILGKRNPLKRQRFALVKRTL